MVNLSREIILEKFPWAKEKSLFDKIDTEQDFDDSIQWNINEEQLNLVVKLLEELEEWFKNQKMEIEIDIYYIGQVFDRLHIDFSSKKREVHLIIDKYKQFSADLLDAVDEAEEDYEDVF